MRVWPCKITCNHFAVFGLFQRYLISTEISRTLLSFNNVIVAKVSDNYLLIEKMIVAEMVNKFARLYRTTRVNTRPYPRPSEFMIHPHQNSLRSVLILLSLLLLYLQSWFPFGFVVGWCYILIAELRWGWRGGCHIYFSPNYGWRRQIVWKSLQRID
jgi:hypothetical protein